VTKLSGMGFTHRPWSMDQARAYVLEAIEIFGAERAMFASDFPTDKLFGSFAQHLDAYAEIVDDFTDGEKRALFARNANRIYRLGLDV
jgi:predicted TIM-barrel fold metal-dependent hydrolase